jgi:hypothetical protein
MVAPAIGKQTSSASDSEADMLSSVDLPRLMGSDNRIISATKRIMQALDHIKFSSFHRPENENGRYSSALLEDDYD